MDAEQQKLVDAAIAEEREKQRRALRDRMSKLGKSRSAKKMAAIRNNIKKGHEVLFGRPYGYRPPKKDKK